MKEIVLTKGFVAIVDDEDYDSLSAYKWHSMKGRYAVRRDGRTYLYMHRVIMNPPENLEVDHISGVGLDNRRANLRIVTHAQNLQNRARQRNNTSTHKGVTWHKQANKWMAQINVNGKYIYLGIHASFDAATAAYIKAANELHIECSR